MNFNKPSTIFQSPDPYIMSIFCRSSGFKSSKAGLATGLICLRIVILTAVLLTACSRASTIAPQTSETLLPVITQEITASATRSPTAQNTSSPPSLTPTAAAPTLSTAEKAQVEASLTQDAYINTELVAMEMPTPTETPCPGGVCTTATSTPTPNFSPTPTFTITPTFPPADIQIVEPGPLSKVISPIHLRSFVHAQANATIIIELIGEDGRLIYRRVSRSDPDKPTYLDFNLNISYDIPGTAEAARLQVTVNDPYQRPVAEVSVDVVLLTMGDASLNPPADSTDSIIIRQPDGSQPISGGILHVEGFVRPLNNSPFLAQLYTQGGSMVGERLFNTPDMPLGVYRPFSVDIPYTVSQLRSTRLTISQQGDHIPGVAILTSMIVQLKP